MFLYTRCRTQGRQASAGRQPPPGEAACPHCPFHDVRLVRPNSPRPAQRDLRPADLGGDRAEPAGASGGAVRILSENAPAFAGGARQAGRQPARGDAGGATRTAQGAAGHAGANATTARGGSSARAAPAATRANAGTHGATDGQSGRTSRAASSTRGRGAAGATADPRPGRGRHGGVHRGAAPRTWRAGTLRFAGRGAECARRRRREGAARPDRGGKHGGGAHADLRRRTPQRRRHVSTAPDRASTMPSSRSSAGTPIRSAG